MANNSSPDQLFGLDDPSLGFIGDGSDTKPDPAFLSDEGPSQSYSIPSANWNFQGTPPYDSYDPSTSAPPHAEPYLAASWQIPTFGQHAGPDAIASSNIDPSSLYAAPISSANPAGLRSRQPGNHHSGAGRITTLTPAVQEQLRNIAMPPHLQYHSPKSASSPDSPNLDLKAGTSTSPDAVDSSGAHSRKRKISADMDDEEEEDEEGKPIKKTAHNMIEKRYRTNLNDKIAALRDSVPSLRIMSKSARGEDTTEDREELHGLTPAHKLNKATVLSKATEYIRHLEKRNSRLQEENGIMQGRLAAFEKLFLAGAMNGSMSPMQQPATPMTYAQPEPQQSYMTGSPGTHDSTNSPVGMIQVPEDMKRIISAQMAAGQPYPVPPQPFRGGNQAVIRQQQIQQHQQMQQNRWNNAAPYFGKLMVGSLAGLMILEAFREDEISSDKPEGRGLFALPVQILGRLASGLDFHVMGYHFHGSLKALLLLGTFLWIFVPSLFTSPAPKSGKTASAPGQPTLSVSSSIQARHQAWLTAAQTIWVPRHSFFLEAAALILKMLKLSLRNAIGVHGYQALTGLTEEQEKARVKAWSIATDSQLTGGDVDINKSRLALTLLASETLPDTPARLMLKALHLRVLLWDLNNILPFGIVNTIAAKFARVKWNEARQLNQMLARLSDSGASHLEDELPEHLAAMVKLECDEVLNQTMIQRAHDLAFQKQRTGRQADDVDHLADDSAIGSPMDAVAAWWSTEMLNRVMTYTLDKNEEAIKERDEHLELAVHTAPVGSVAQVRAIVARAVLVDKSRGAHIALALKAVDSNLGDESLTKPTAMINEPRITSNVDLQLALQCATSIAHLRRIQSTGDTPHRGLRLIQKISIPVESMSLLGCTAVLELIEHVLEHKAAAETYQSCLERVVGNLRLWVGSPAVETCGLDIRVQHKLVDRCVAINKSLVGMDTDTGYGSLSENEADD
ncbi:hypothetical protein B0I35DRAFT_408567 [Stachybotrys elegans]|uniref:BHLH domain-containing protein n=1 Tax=Stachybotrys elegans TaxID=80388 RepID=A0A8K0SVX4_9HYPO|nr:hypothetical protein B0I35DRAFT_408567 [Stachybotrys elegans]